MKRVNAMNLEKKTVTKPKYNEINMDQDMDEDDCVPSVRLPKSVITKLKAQKKAEMGNRRIFDLQDGHIKLKNGKTVKNVFVIHLSFVTIKGNYNTDDIVDVIIKKPWITI